MRGKAGILHVYNRDREVLILGDEEGLYHLTQAAQEAAMSRNGRGRAEVTLEDGTSRPISLFRVDQKLGIE